MTIRRLTGLGILALGIWLTIPVAAQKLLFTDTFTSSEFAARRAKVMSAIGDGVAIASGATETATYTKFRQGASFYYLSGVEVPRAILVIDGRAKSSTLFLPAHDNLEKSEGPRLGPDDEAKRLTGVEQVADRAAFDAVVKAIAADGRTIYMPLREEALGAGTTDRIRSHATATAADPWDGRKSKDVVFKDKVQAIAAKSEFKDLDPVVDGLRMIKSTAEIALMRESARIASAGILAAMKAAKPGMFEYELEAAADYEFKRHNAQGIAYFALVATGTNSAWAHYHAAQAQLGAGDLVLMDYAPDYKYYASDVTRMFPASGTFSPRQRELYGIYLKLYQALMASIRPGPAKDGLADAYQRMQKVMASFTFTDAKIKDAATRFVAGYANPRTSYGHMLGMDTHDVSVAFDGILKPGLVFTIEPALTIPDERVYVRLEDPIVITATGFENLSAGLPEEIAEIERVMKAGKTAGAPPPAPRRPGGRPRD
jgi:Xaa-Pro aminopeptidase